MRRGLSISEYGVQTSRPRRSSRPARRRSCTPSSATSSSRPSCARTAASWPPRARAACRTLVEPGDLRGDLHTHTHWSDGATPSRRWRRPRARGYSYLAIMRPLPAAARRRARGAGGGDRRGRRAGQAAEAPEGRRGRTSAPTATLDMSDDDLADRDWVVASLHSRVRQEPDRADPRRDGEPARRLHRPPDRPQDQQARRPRTSTWSASIEAALATNTCLEINSQPDRLDLRDAHARAAAEAGVRIPSTATATASRRSRTSRSASAQARRAWLTKEQVLNTRPWSRSRPGSVTLPRATATPRSSGPRATSSGSATCRCWHRSSRASCARACLSRRRSDAEPFATCCATSTR